jgi:hypothetical protein
VVLEKTNIEHLFTEFSELFSCMMMLKHELGITDPLIDKDVAKQKVDRIEKYHSISNYLRCEDGQDH